MFRQILYTQWKWSMVPVALATIAAFAVPLLCVQSAGAISASPWQVIDLLSSVGQWGVLYPILAGTIGLVLALTTWGNDHRGQHVYALSVPIPRWHYVLLRFGAGVVLLIPVIAALFIGALAATAASTLPPGLYAYPLQIGLRFALATLLAYATFFAILAGSNRTAGYVLGAIGALVAAQILVATTSLHVDILGTVVGWLVTSPGPFQVFSGSWMLINV